MFLEIRLKKTAVTVCRQICHPFIKIFTAGSAKKEMAKTAKNAVNLKIIVRHYIIALVLFSRLLSFNYP